MRVAVISDIHSNLHALEAVLEEIAEFDLETWNASQPPQTLGFDDPVMLPE